MILCEAFSGDFFKFVIIPIQFTHSESDIIFIRCDASFKKNSQ